MEAALRNSVWERAQAKCEYCRMPQHLDRLTFEVEHILPVKHGGAAALENLALACFFCNRYKGPNLAGIDSESGQVVTLFHPRREVWSEHFVWSEGTLKGLTPMLRPLSQYYASMMRRAWPCGIFLSRAEISWDEEA